MHREIVVGVGDLDDSADALGFAFEEAALRKARLIAVHAWSCFLPAPGPGDKLTAGERATANPPLSPERARGCRTFLPDGRKNTRPSKSERKSCTRIPLTCSLRRPPVPTFRTRPEAPGATDRSGVGSVIAAVLHHANGPVAIVAGWVLRWAATEALARAEPDADGVLTGDDHGRMVPSGVL